MDKLWFLSHKWTRRWLMAMGMVLLLLVALTIMPLSSVSAQMTPVINEFVFSHVGTDNREYIEVFFTPTTDLSLYRLVVIEGDAVTTTGNIIRIITPGSTDAAGFYSTGFLPTDNLQNGSQTLLLVQGFSGTLNQDLDTNNDGTLDVMPWTSVIDGVAVTDVISGDFTYTSVVLSPNFDGGTFSVGGASRIPNGTDTNATSDWVRNDFDLAGIPGFTGTLVSGEALNTPGAVNSTTLADTPPSVSSTIPANGATNVSSSTTLTVTFSESVNLAANAVTLECPPGTAISLTQNTASPATSFIFTPQTTLPNSQNCTASVESTAVSDTDGTVDNMTADYGFSFTTQSTAVCGTTATLISTIQGSGATSSFVGTVQTVEAVVVGDYQGDSFLNGFYIQEEDAQADGNPNTSEGIFVAADTPDVGLGNLVHVTGTVAEFVTDDGAGTNSQLTRIQNVTSVVTCSTAALPAATTLTFPLSNTQREALEGMRVTVPTTMTVMETFELGRFGVVELYATGQPYQYRQTSSNGAGFPAYIANTIVPNSLILDDGRGSIRLDDQNPDPIIYPTPAGLSAANTLRSGYQVSNINGILDNRIGSYRIQADLSNIPTSLPTFNIANPRPSSPPAVGGRIQIASFNVLNYFNGPAFPTSRGASTAGEFARQRAKIINAMIGLGAEVYGLIELENDVDSGALQDLVAGLNTATAAGTFAYIDTGVIGTDEIRVALIYRPGDVTPVGSFSVLNHAAFSNARPPLAQLFEENSTGEQFYVVVNHFKSKSGTGTGGDADLNDGQGNFNASRVAQATALANYIQNDPYFDNDPDVLVIGDLNSYYNEDPLLTLYGQGFQNLASAGDYTYQFDGMIGTLDHALGTSSAAAQVTDAESWHINSDEPSVLDYNTEFKSVGQISSLYSSDQYRASDHDPALIGLNLSSPGAFIQSAGGTVPENGTQNVVVELDTTAALSSDLPFNIAVVAGTTATEGADFTLGSTTVTFPAASTDGATQFIQMNLLDDSLLEGTETVVLELSPVGGGRVIPPITVQYSITDDETAQAAFAQAASTVVEATAGIVNVDVNLNITGTAGGTAAIAPGVNLTVDAALAGMPGTAIAGIDYTFANPTTLTFNSGTALTQPVALTVTDDSLIEGDETVELVLQNTGGTAGVNFALGTQAAHTLTIDDDETATIAFQNAAGTTANESTPYDASLVLTITGTAGGAGQLAVPFTVDLAVGAAPGTATEGADYDLPTPPTVTIAAGSASGVIANNILLLDDSLIEGDETAGIQLVNLVDTTGSVSLGAQAAHTFTIPDDDTAAAAFAQPGLTTPNEANASYNLDIALTLTGTTATPPSLSAPVTIGVGVSSGSATNGTDYTFTDPSNVTFEAGATSGATLAASFTVIDDPDVEGPELAQFTLSASSDLATASAAPFTATITDDDGATISFEAIDSSVAESGGTHNVVVALNIAGGGTLSEDVTITVSAADVSATNGADYNFSPITLTFAAGSGSSTQNVVVTILEDADLESSETLTLSLSGITGGGGAATIGSQSAHTVTITDNDVASAAFQNASFATPNEDTAGMVNVPVVLILPGGGTLPTQVTFSVLDAGTGSATSGVDYTAFAPNPLVLSFSAGSANGAVVNVPVTILADSEVEAAETIQLQLAVTEGPAVNGAQTTSSVSITDDDTIVNTPENTPTHTPTPSTPSPTSTVIPTATLPPATVVPAIVFLCDNLGAQSMGEMTATGSVGNVSLGNSVGNVYCTIIVRGGTFARSAGEIGVQSVLDLGVRQAVSLYGLLEGGIPVVRFTRPMEVCLRGSGDVLFLSALDIPRRPVRLTPLATSPAGFVCVSVPNSGILALVGQASSIPMSTPPAPSQPHNDQNCRVTTTAQVRLRSGASLTSSLITTLPYNITLQVTDHTIGWYRVIYLDGQGWVSAAFVTPVGDC